MRIETKQQFYKLWLSGQLGNRLGAWRADGDLTAARRLPWVSIRGTVPNIPMTHPVAACDIDSTLERLCRTRGRELRDFMVCQGTPDQYDPAAVCSLVVQGELTERPGGWYFFHSSSKLTMRHALDRHGEHSEGYGVEDYLRRVCTPDSFNDIVDLLEVYPSHIIELAVYTRCLGILPHRNTIIWEVRSY